MRGHVDRAPTTTVYVVSLLDSQGRGWALRVTLTVACAAAAASVWMPWATLDLVAGAKTTVRPGIVGLVLVALAAGVMGLSWRPERHTSNLSQRICTLSGALATLVSIVLALRAISTANRLAAAGNGPSVTSYGAGAAVAVAASMTVTAISIARSTEAHATSSSHARHP